MFGISWGWVNDDFLYSHKSLLSPSCVRQDTLVMQCLLGFWSLLPSYILRQYDSPIFHRKCVRMFVPQTMAWDLPRQQEHNTGKPNIGELTAVIVLKTQCDARNMRFGAAQSIVPTAAGMWTTRDTVFMEIFHFLWSSVDALLNEIFSPLNPLLCVKGLRNTEECCVQWTWKLDFIGHHRDP